MADYFDTTTGQPLEDWHLEQRFDEALDGCGPVDVLGLEYGAGRLLRAVDPIRYRCEFADWLDATTTDGQLAELSELSA